jgi:uncharacterized protein (TIGR02231 family)
MRTLLLGPLILLGLASTHRAVAAEIEAHSRIDSVVVRPDAAQVTRIAELDLPAGLSTIVFKGLPIGLDPGSLRVAGEASGQLAIGSVDARLTATETKSPDTGLETRLRNLRSERDGWQATLDALEAKKAMILRFSQAGPEKLAPDTQPLEIAQWPSAWDAVGAGLAKVGDELRSARARAREIDDEIKVLETTRQRPSVPLTPSREVAVAVETGAALSGRLALTYQIAGASWQPSYDALLDSGGPGRKPVLELVRRAIVMQRSGEDWNNVTLAVSTGGSSRGTAAPEVQPQKLDFFEPPIAEARGQAAAPKAAAQEAATLAAPEPVARKAASEVAAGVEVSNYQAAFRVPDRISVLSDGTQKSFLIGSQRLSPTLVIRASPALDPKAFIELRFSNEEEAALLAGDVSLHRDGAFVGTGHLLGSATGDELALGFGADDRVKVVRVPVKRKENEPAWLGATKTESREFKTTVKNGHDFPVRVIVTDQMPFSENSAIVIEQLPATTPPSEKMPGDKRGVLSWSYDLAPGESKEIRLAYKMKWPADREVILQRVPQPR